LERAGELSALHVGREELLGVVGLGSGLGLGLGWVVGLGLGWGCGRVHTIALAAGKGTRTGETQTLQNIPRASNTYTNPPLTLSSFTIATATGGRTDSHSFSTSDLCSAGSTRPSRTRCTS